MIPIYWISYSEQYHTSGKTLYQNHQCVSLPGDIFKNKIEVL